VYGEQSGFYREYWAVFDPAISNQPDGNRWRVNDPAVSLHPKWGTRWEGKANGLMLISIDEDLFNLRAAQLYLELWGGHPHTRNKQVILNGKATYTLPEAGTQAGHCTYSYPELPIDLNHLVSGTNALQFRCERGSGFWGHYIIDQAAIRCDYQPDHPALRDLQGFAPQIITSIEEDQIRISLQGAQLDKYPITRVTYLGRYSDFDDRGENRTDGWHGFTRGRVWQNAVGSATQPPFEVNWDVTMIPDQPRDMALCALIDFANGLKYRTFAAGVALPPRPYTVRLYNPVDLPKPFWSRAGEQRETTLELDLAPDQIEAAVLCVKVWDGGEGSVANPFLLNEHPYSVTSGRATHDVVFTKTAVDPDHLKHGENRFTLLSDTEHHGIEVLLPGPCLKIKSSPRE